MPIVMVGKFDGPRLGDLLLDATVSEGHEFENETTDSPVEEGVSFTDHILAKPRMLTIEGIVSDTPIMHRDSIEAAGFDTARNGFGRGKQAFETLERIFFSRIPITVATKLATYPNMVITRLSIPRGSTTGDALRFTASLKEIRVVRTSRARLQVRTTVENGRVKDKVPGGTQPTQPASEKTTGAVASSFGLQLGQLVGALK